MYLSTIAGESRVGRVFWYGLVVLVVFSLAGCGNDDTSTNPDNTTVPLLTTAVVSSVTQTTAECGGIITSDGGAPITAYGVCWSTDATPTISDSKTTDGAGEGSFASSIAGLTNGTPFYVRAYATNSAGTGYGNEVTFSTSISDVDGNVYETVIIGSQVWMSENLEAVHYRNGDPISHVTDSTAWRYLTYGGYCNYNNDADNVATYGRLYNWLAVDDSRNVAPSGWHVPTLAEWQTLADYLGFYYVAGGKMKEAGSTHWQAPNAGATNESGFSGLPGGLRDAAGRSTYMGSRAYFWCSTVKTGYTAYSYNLNHLDSATYSVANVKESGLSIRCVRD